MLRSSSAEFLIFTTQSGKENIDVCIEDENIWLTQKLIAKLFGVGINTVNYHLKEIFNSNELQENAVIRKFRITAADFEGNEEHPAFGKPKPPLFQRDGRRSLTAFRELIKKEFYEKTKHTRT